MKILKPKYTTSKIIPQLDRRTGRAADVLREASYAVDDLSIAYYLDGYTAKTAVRQDKTTLKKHIEKVSAALRELTDVYATLHADEEDIVEDIVAARKYENALNREERKAMRARHSC